MTSSDAAQIRNARRQRVRLIRSRVVGATVAMFMGVWSLITVLLVTGHDPALAKKQAATTAPVPTTTTSASGSTSTATSSSAGTSSATGSSGSATISPVTSGQS